jgi:23S rRNA pseudouridine2604 synthase
MCGVLGFKVIRLERIRILNITSDNIESGKWRYISEGEIKELKEKYILSKKDLENNL